MNRREFFQRLGLGGLMLVVTKRWALPSQGVSKRLDIERLPVSSDICATALEAAIRQAGYADRYELHVAPGDAGYAVMAAATLFGAGWRAYFDIKQVWAWEGLYCWRVRGRDRWVISDGGSGYMPLGT